MPYFPKSLVVVPLDFSAASMGALEIGLGLVDDPRNLRVIHVLQDLSPLEAGEVWGVIDPQTRIEAARNTVREKLIDTPIQPSQIEVRMGDAASGITTFAEEVHAQLIVLPSHGRTGITRMIMGSVAERVVRLAHCPVLVLRD